MSKNNDLRDHAVYRMSLYSTIADRNGKIFFQDRFGVSLREYRILGVISYSQPVSLTDLAEECYLDKGQVSRVVTKLESMGYLTKQQGTDPITRKGKISLTSEGQDLVRKATEYGDELNDRALSVLTPEERAAFSETLDRLLVQAREMSSEVHKTTQS